MALIHFDGFETYEDKNDLTLFKSSNIASLNILNGSYIAVGDYGRRSGRGFRLWNGIDGLRWNFESSYSTIIFGIAIYQNISGTTNYQSVISFQEGGQDQLRFGINSSGQFVITNQGGTSIGTSSGSGISYGVWRYIEIKATIDNSSGAIEILSNGISIYDETGLDTQYTSNANVDAIRVQYLGIETYFDDLYICDTTGSKNNDFLGDCRIDVIRPNAAGTYTDFTPLSGANYENVDESYGSDEDTTYNEGSNVADQDTYNMGSLPSPAGTIIHGVKNQIVARKTDATAREVKILTRSGSTDHLSGAIGLSENYTIEAEIIEDNPDDASAWEDADINAMQVGIEITA